MKAERTRLASSAAAFNLNLTPSVFSPIIQQSLGDLEKHLNHMRCKIRRKKGKSISFKCKRPSVATLLSAPPPVRQELLMTLFSAQPSSLSPSCTHWDLKPNHLLPSDTLLRLPAVSIYQTPASTRTQPAPSGTAGPSLVGGAGVGGLLYLCLCIVCVHLCACATFHLSIRTECINVCEHVLRGEERSS